MKGLQLSKNKISQKISLRDLFGVDLSGNRRLKEQIGQAIIDKIVDRTASGKDVSGTPLKKYSEGYTESAAFEKYGKDKNNVDMELKGDMMEDLDIKKMTGNDITIGFNGTLSNKKAANHNGGFTLPTRQFFGVTVKDLLSIKKEFRSDIAAIRQKKKAKEEAVTLAELLTRTENESALDKLIKGLISDGES